MAFHQLKHYSRIHTLEEEGYMSFALIGGPSKDEDYKDFCVTLVRCKEKNLTKELRNWGRFTNDDIEMIKELGHGEVFVLDYASKVIRLS